MGNSLIRGVSLRNYEHFPYHVQLGRYAAIDADKVSDEDSWTLSYTVGGSKCVLGLEWMDIFGSLIFELDDDIFSGDCIRLDIIQAENDLLELHYKYPSIRKSADKKLVKTKETYNPCGGVTKTDVYFYGSGSKGGLFVTEQKIKNGDMKPYKVTLAHYYAASSGNVFTQNKIDVGLSMVLNVWASNNELDFTVEGPVQQPSSALFYMFEQVFKTGIWKPMACPHCASQRQSSGIFRQSESEDSDSLPPARLRGPMQDSRSVIANDGVIRGNNNGNLIVIINKRLSELL